MSLRGPANDFRLADDFLLFGTDYHVIGLYLHKLVEHFAVPSLSLSPVRVRDYGPVKDTG